MGRIYTTLSIFWLFCKISAPDSRGRGVVDGNRESLGGRPQNCEDVRDSEEDEPLLMKRHQSLDENRQRCSLGKNLGQNVTTRCQLH